MMSAALARALERSEQRQQPLGLAQMAEHAHQERARRNAQSGAPANHFGLRRKVGGQREQLRDFVHRGPPHVLLHQRRSARVVHNHRARPLRHALDHRIAEVFRIRGRARAPAPQFARQVFAPVTVVIDELRDVLLFVPAAQEEMMQHRVVQHRYARRLERMPVDFAVQWVVAEMIERNVDSRAASRVFTFTAPSGYSARNSSAE